jgi:hypothetical protein
MRLDEVLPEYDVVERHARDIAAPPDRVYAALRTIDFADSPVIRLLWRLRSLGTERAMTWDALLRLGFVEVADDPPRELVLGLLAQPWRLRGAIQRPSAAEWHAFDRADFAKIAWSFALAERPDGGTTLATETRVRVRDRASRRKFVWYWRAIGPFSAWIRREMLKLAERASTTT